MNNLIDELQSDKNAFKCASKTGYDEWSAHPVSYRIDRTYHKGQTYVFLREENGKGGEYRIFYNSFLEENPLHYLRRMFKTFNKGKSMGHAFGMVGSNEFLFCIPKPIYYARDDFGFMTIENASEIDVTSMFPASLKGRMPDAKRKKIVKGIVDPDDEFPFAFWPTTHHCTELGVFDTRDYVDNYDIRMRARLTITDGRRNIYEKPGENAYTILMPASEFTFNDVIDDLMYKKRNGDERERLVAKATSNMMIGCLHHNPKRMGKDEIDDFYHIAAVVIGRSNQKQLNKKLEIEASGGIVLQMIVDSIIYTGPNPLNFAYDEKIVGEYFAEIKNAKYRSTGQCNKYAFEKGGKIIKVRASGIASEEHSITRLEDIDKFIGGFGKE